MGNNSEQEEEKNSDNDEVSHQHDSKEILHNPTTIIKPGDDFKKDLKGKDRSRRQCKSTQEGVKREAIDEKNNLQLEPSENMESELLAHSGVEKIEKPATKMVADKCLHGQMMKCKNSQNVDTLSLSCKYSSILNLVLSLKEDDSPKLKDLDTQKKDLFSREPSAQEHCPVPSSASPAGLPAGVQYFQEEFKRDRELWESFVDTCSALTVTDHCAPSVTSEPQSLQEMAKMGHSLSSQPTAEDETDQHGIFSHPELEQEGKQSSLAPKESPVLSSLPSLPPPDVPKSDERGRKPIPKKVYASLAKRKLQQSQGGKDACLKPLHRKSQTQAPHTVPRPPLAVSPEVRTQLVARPLQPQLVPSPWPRQSSNGVTSTNTRLPLLPTLGEGLGPLSIPRRFPFPAVHLPGQKFSVKEAHGGRKGADRPPDQDTGSTSTGSGGTGGGSEESGEGESGGGGGMSGSGASGGGDGDPPEHSEDNSEEEEEEEEEDEEEKKKDEEQSSKTTQEDSGYKSPGWSSSQSGQQTSEGTTEQGALVTQESSGAGLGTGVYNATLTGHYPDFYLTNLQPFYPLMSPSQRDFYQTMSPSNSPPHTPSQSPPTSPLHTPPHSPSSSLVLPSFSSPYPPSFSPPPLPMSVEETQLPIAQSTQLVATATGQDQQLPHEPQHNEDVCEEPDVEPDPVPFQNGPTPSQNDPKPFLSPHGEGQGLFPLGLESGSVHDSDSSSERSRDSG